MSVELQLETHGEFSHDNFKLQVDKASGARYGTGVRDLWYRQTPVADRIKAFQYNWLLFSAFSFEAFVTFAFTLSFHRRIRELNDLIFYQTFLACDLCPVL